MPLDPEVAALLAREKSLPPRSSLDIAATRQRMRRGDALAGPRPDLAKVEDLELGAGLKARQYWPAEEDGRLPLVVYFHGGRFFSGDLESHDSLCRQLALAAGCRVVAVDYRMAPEHRFPAATEDACAALRWAAGQSVPFAVAGDSAGANLAAVAARECRSLHPRCQVLVYPMIDAGCESESYSEFAEGFGPGADDMRRGWEEYLPEGVDRQDPLASPLYAEDLAGVAPAFVMTAEYDTLRDEGEAYAVSLIEAGVLVQVRRYPGTIHGFFGMPGTLAVARLALADASRFLRASLEQ